jgi:hypothetical protein
VTELIALDMVAFVGMIESEMGYCATNPFSIRNISIALFYL